MTSGVVAHWTPLPHSPSPSPSPLPFPLPSLFPYMEGSFDPGNSKCKHRWFTAHNAFFFFFFFSLSLSLSCKKSNNNNNNNNNNNSNTNNTNVTCYLVTSLSPSLPPSLSPSPHLPPLPSSNGASLR